MNGPWKAVIEAQIPAVGMGVRGCSHSKIPAAVTENGDAAVRVGETRGERQ